MVVRERQRILVQIEFAAEQAWIGLRAGESVARDALLAGLKRARVVFGHLPEAFAEAARASDEPRRLVVARGVPAATGTPGAVEHILDPFRLPRLEHFDGFDFAEMLRSRRVQAGDPLLSVLPPKPGRYGMDVHGRTLQPPSGRDIDINRLVGEGTRICGEDGDVIEAAVDGLFHRDATGRVHVLQLVEVHGDADRAHGDIDSRLPLLIHGDIADGMRVKSAGDIIVLGAVGDARVSAQGCLLVRGTIRAGTQRVKAHGDLLAGRIIGRQVKAHRVAVLGAVRDSEILASDTVSALEVVGGSIVAANGLRCEHLGSTFGGATRIEVGRDPLFDLHSAHARENMPALGRKAAELRLACNQAARELDSHALDDSAPACADELRRLVGDYRQVIKDLAVAREILARQRPGGRGRLPITATIEVTDTVRPGVVVAFGQLSETVAAPLRRPCFAVRDERIVH